MKQLKTILGAVYPILIILLLLSNCRGGRKTGAAGGDGTVGEPMDSARAVRTAEETGNSGNLKITLLWDFQGDIDLLVVQPNGKTISFQDKTDASTGGALDVDNLKGGHGSAENMVWENPPEGAYYVSLNYYQPSVESKLAESGVCTVVVMQQGKSPQTYQVEMNRVKETKDVVTINIQ